jgi:hypothetical protein
MGGMNVLPTQVAPPAARPALPRWADLKRVADAQRVVLFTFLGAALAIPGLAAIGAALGASGGSLKGAEIAIVLVVILRLWMAVAVYRLAKAMGSKVGVLWALGSFLPSLIGLLVLAAISARGTKHLQKAGLKVGFLGAKLPENPPPGFLCEEIAGAFA